MGSLVAGSKAVLLKGTKPETILSAVSSEHCTIVWLLVTLIALYLVAQLFAILQSFSMTKLTACVMETLRGDIDRKMHHLKLDYYDSHT